MLLRQAWRRAFIDRTGSTLAALTLAVGIGLATAALSLFESAVRQPLEVPHPDRLVNISGAAHPRDTSVEDWFGRAPSLQGVASFRLGRAALRMNGQDALLQAAEVSAGFFEVMGLSAALGRLFVRDSGDTMVAVISHAVWQQRFGGDPDVLRRFVTIGTTDFAIVAVAPARFTFPGETEVWVPRPDGNRFLVDLDMSEVAEGSFRIPTGIVARIREGADTRQVTSQVSELQREYERTRLQSGLLPSVVRVRDLRGALAERSRAMALGFVAACLVLLTAAGASFAHLAVVRALARRGEFALRRALGASTAQLYCGSLVDHGLLAAAGLSGGLVIAWSALGVLSALLPTTVPNVRTLTLEGEALAAGAALTLLIVVAASALGIQGSGDRALVPHVRGVQGAVTSSLGNRLRAGLLVVQWSAALALLVVALLLTKSLHRLQQVDFGIDTERVLTAEVRLPSVNGDRSGRVAAWQHLLTMIADQPETSFVALADRLPLASSGPGRQHVRTERRETFAVVRTVSSGYFDALSIRLVAGRGFTGDSFGVHTNRVVVNEAAAEALGAQPGEVGWTLELEGAWHTVEGIARNTAEGPTVEEALPSVYLPVGANGLEVDAAFVLMSGRAGVPPITNRLPAIVRAVDPAATVTRVRAMRDVVALVYGPQRLRAFVVLTLALAATVVAGLGAFASVSLTVSQKARELAIRSALGCSPARLARHVVTTVAKPLGLALAVGLGLAVTFSASMRALLYAVEPADAGSLAAASGILTLAVSLATVGPVRRALRTDVALTLRSQ